MHISSMCFEGNVTVKNDRDPRAEDQASTDAVRSRAPYEAPALRSSMAFERLALGCTGATPSVPNTPNKEPGGGFCTGTAGS